MSTSFPRRLRVMASLAFAAVLAACGGGGGGGSLPPAGGLPAQSTSIPQSTGSTATPSPAPSSTPNPQAIALPSGVSSFSAQIASVSSTLIFVQARPGCGYYHFNVNSSTTYFNGPPQAGQWGVFTGVNAPCSTSFTAQTASISAAAATSSKVTGTVTARTSNGFTLNAGASAPSVPVVLTSNTVVFGGTLAVGANASVTGLGSSSADLVATQIAVAAPTPNPSASPTATPGPIAVKHVMVAGWIYGYAGTPTTVLLSSITPYVNWAQTNLAHAAMLRSAGIKVNVYSKFWRDNAVDNPSTGYNDIAPGGAHAAAEAKDCSGNVLHDTTYGGGYEADPRTSAALGHAHVVVDPIMSAFGSNMDALYADQTGTVGGMPTPCDYNQAQWDAAVNAVHSALGMPMWLNSLGGFSDPSTAVDLANPSNVLGLMCEMCYSRNPSTGDSVDTGIRWQRIENAQIALAAMHKIFWAYPRATGDPTAETALRTYVYASFLLGFDPNYAMLTEAFQTPSGFPVMPESGLVALQPLTTASSVSGYAAPGGSYFREFAACYYRGSFVNQCAVVINSSPTATVPVPTTSYSHSLVLSGSGVLDGGTASFTGPQVTQLAPSSAAILFP